MEHLVLPENEGDDSMNVQETMLQTEVDVASIAKEIRGLIKNVPGAVFSVRINRQWAKLKNNPHSVIYVEGMVKLWGDDYTPEKEQQSKLLMQGIIKDVVEEHNLEVHKSLSMERWTLTQQH